MNKLLKILITILYVFAGVTLFFISFNILLIAIDNLDKSLYVIILTGILGVLIIILGYRLLNAEIKIDLQEKNGTETVAKVIKNNIITIFTSILIIGLTIWVSLWASGFFHDPDRSAYSARSQVYEAMKLIENLKPQLSKYYKKNNEWPDKFQQFLKPDERMSMITGKYVEIIQIKKNANKKETIILEVVFKKTNIDTNLKGKMISFSSNEDKYTQFHRTIQYDYQGNRKRVSRPQ